LEACLHRISCVCDPQFKEVFESVKISKKGSQKGPKSQHSGLGMRSPLEYKKFREEVEISEVFHRKEKLRAGTHTSQIQNQSEKIRPILTTTLFIILW